MAYSLFLDDFRQPIDSFDYTNNQLYLLNWIVVKNYDEFVNTVLEKSIPSMVSFDHDLCYEDIEEWKDVVGYEGIYKVSTLGRVIRTKRCRGTSGNNILTPHKGENGLTVQLRNMGNDYRVAIHIIECIAFYGIDSNKPQVNHKDGNRWNNNINNLEWCTQSENITHSHRELERDFSAYGENHKNSKSVSQYDKSNNLVNVYGSVNEAGRQLHISFENIAKCARGERKTAGGYVWKYENGEVTKKTETEHITNKDYCTKFFIPEKKEKTGYDCAKWLIDYCIDNKKELPAEILIHSMNPAGSLNIKSLFDTYFKIYGR